MDRIIINLQTTKIRKIFIFYYIKFINVLINNYY